MVTCALLAESASIVEGKLNVQGGVLRSCQVGHDRIARLNLIVFTQYEAGDQAPTLTVELRRPDDDAQTMQVDWPLRESPEGEIGFAFWPLWLPVETDGVYRVTVSGDNGSVSLPLKVRG